MHTKTTRRVTLFGRLSAAIVLGLLVAYSNYPGLKTASAASATCTSITDCSNQISDTSNKVSDLKNQAVSYQDAITRLSSQISTVQSQISDSQSQQASLEHDIADAQTQIDTQKGILGEDLRTMYIDGQMSTIEELATSNNLSDYVNKEEYRTAVQTSLQASLDKIAKLQQDLQVKKDAVEALLKTQQQDAVELQNDQSTQSSMLSMNKSQQADYNAQTAANQAKLNALIAAQRTANTSSKGGYYFIRFPGSAHSFNDAAYPYANAGFSMSTAPGCNNGDGPDQWGYCTRQCVSYAAWAVQASGRSAPKFWGNAKNWVAAARRAGIPLYNVPQPGDVAISTTGTWGHAMYVEQVSGRQIYVAQYNQQLTGQFSHQWRQWE